MKRNIIEIPPAECTRELKAQGNALQTRTSQLSKLTG